MRAAFATLALVVLAAAEAVPQGVTSAVTPPGSAPAGCSPNYDGTFEISPVNASNTKRSLEERNTQLGITLKNGILTDPQGRTGYIASNSQFQFDDPPQAGAIYTAGFTVCQNGSLAIGNDAIWYKCLSGTFFNLYLENDAGQCTQCYLVASPINGAGGPVSVSGSATTTSGLTSSSVPANTTVTTSTSAHNGTMTSGTTSKHTGATTATTHTGAGQTTGGTTQAPQTTSSAGSATSAASSSSSSGVAVAMGPVGDAFGIVAGLLAFAAI